jgi:hypothetical protein
MNNMRSNNFWLNLIGGLAQELILELFSDKKSESKEKYKEQETQDLGYAVVVDDNGNEI